MAVRLSMEPETERSLEQLDTNRRPRRNTGWDVEASQQNTRFGLQQFGIAVFLARLVGTFEEHETHQQQHT